jgi:hypothetical protein
MDRIVVDNSTAQQFELSNPIALATIAAAQQQQQQQQHRGILPPGLGLVVNAAQTASGSFFILALFYRLSCSWPTLTMLSTSCICFYMFSGDSLEAPPLSAGGPRRLSNPGLGEGNELAGEQIPLVIHGGRGGFRGRGRGRGGFANRAYAPYSDNRRVSIGVDRIPLEHCNIASLNAHFGKFGPIVNINIIPAASRAIIEYTTHDSAQKAYSSPEAVFGNRFVKVFFARPEDLEVEGGGAPAAASSVFTPRAAGEARSNGPKPGPLNGSASVQATPSAGPQLALGAPAAPFASGISAAGAAGLSAKPATAGATPSKAPIDPQKAILELQRQALALKQKSIEAQQDLMRKLENKSLKPEEREKLKEAFEAISARASVENTSSLIEKATQMAASHNASLAAAAAAKKNGAGLNDKEKERLDRELDLLKLSAAVAQSRKQESLEGGASAAAAGLLQELKAEVCIVCCCTGICLARSRANLLVIFICFFFNNGKFG